MSEADAVPPSSRVHHRVKLWETVSVGSSTDLLYAVVENAQRLGEGSVAATVRRYNLAVEVRNEGDDPVRRRTLVFRRFRRAPGGTVLGGRAPLFDEVEVTLTKSEGHDAWMAKVTNVASGRDRSLHALARLPQASPQQQPRMALQLRSVLRALEPLPGIAAFEVAHSPENQSSPGDRVVVSMTTRRGITSLLKVRVSPETGLLEVSTWDGLAKFPPVPLFAGPDSPRWVVRQGIETALILPLAYFAGLRLGHAVAPPDGSCYLTGPDGRVGSAAAYMKVAALHHANQLLDTKTISKQARRYAHELRDQLIDELEARAGSPDTTVNRKILYEMFPRVKPVIERYGTKHRRTRLFDAPADVLGLPTQLVIGSIPGWSNLLAAVFSPDPGQQLRYGYGLVATAPLRTARRWRVDRSMSREVRDRAAPEEVFRYGVRPELVACGTGAAFDSSGRATVSLLLSDGVDPLLLNEIVVRRMAAGFATGLSDYGGNVQFAPAVFLADHAKKVAGRGEVLNEFLAAQDELELLFGTIPGLLADHKPPKAGSAKLTELVTLLRAESRETGGLLARNGLATAALRTKSAPLRSPGRKAVFSTQVGPAAVGTAAGTLASVAHPALGLLGLRSLVDVAVQSQLSTVSERSRAKDRARQAKANQAYQLKAADDLGVAAEAALAEQHPRTKAQRRESRSLPPLPKAKRHLPGLRPHLQDAALTSLFSSPLSAVGFVVPELKYLAVGLLLSGVPSPWTNQLYAWTHRVLSYRQGVRAEAEGKEIALAEQAPTSLADLEARLTTVLDKITEIGDRTAAAVSTAGLPAKVTVTRGATTAASGASVWELSVTDVFAELKRRDSVVLLERFKRLVAECGGSERKLYRRLRLLVPGYEDLKPERQAAAVAEAFDEAHEAQIEDVAKLEVMDRYMAEYVPDEFRLAAIWPAGSERRVTNEEYVRFAHVVQGMWFVSDPANPRRISDVTGRYAAVAWLAAIANGAGHVDPADPEKYVLDVPAATRLVPQAAALFTEDIKRLAAGWSVEDLLAGEPSERGIKSIRSEAAAARHLLARLKNETFRQRYTDRLTEALAWTKSAIAAEASHVVATPAASAADVEATSSTTGSPEAEAARMSETPTVSAGFVAGDVVVDEAFAELLSVPLWSDPVDSGQGDYLVDPRTGSGEKPGRESHVVFSHDSGAYIREWPTERPDQPTVVVVRRAGTDVGAGRLSPGERKLLAEASGVIVECGLPDHYDAPETRQRNWGFEVEQFLLALRHAQLSYGDTSIVVVGDNDCESVIKTADLYRIGRFSEAEKPRNFIEVEQVRVGQPRLYVNRNADGVTDRDVLPARNALPKSTTRHLAGESWESFGTWPDRFRLTLAELDVLDDAGAYIPASGSPTSEDPRMLALREDLVALAALDVWSPPEDRHEESYLVRPRTRAGEEPKTTSRLMFSRREGPYVREWPGSREDYPIVVAVRRCRSEAGSGRLSQGELYFLDKPRGPVFECGVPDFHDSPAGRARDLGYAVKQVTAVLKQAEALDPSREIILVGDQDCDQVIHRVMSAGSGLDATRILHRRSSSADADEDAWSPTWTGRLGPLFGQLRRRRATTAQRTRAQLSRRHRNVDAGGSRMARR